MGYAQYGDGTCGNPVGLVTNRELNAGKNGGECSAHRHRHSRLYVSRRGQQRAYIGKAQCHSGLSIPTISGALTSFTTSSAMAEPTKC